MGFLFYLVTSLFIFVCFILILLVLIQKGRGGGLVSAFGGMGGNTAFGSKTWDVLTWATSIIFGVFLLLAGVVKPPTGGSFTAMTAPPRGPPIHNPRPARRPPPAANP